MAPDDIILGSRKWCHWDAWWISYEIGYDICVKIDSNGCQKSPTLRFVTKNGNSWHHYDVIFPDDVTLRIWKWCIKFSDNFPTLPDLIVGGGHFAGFAKKYHKIHFITTSTLGFYGKSFQKNIGKWINLYSIF